MTVENRKESLFQQEGLWKQHVWCLEALRADFLPKDSINCVWSMQCLPSIYINLITVLEMPFELYAFKTSFFFLYIEITSFLTTDLSIATICDALSLTLWKNGYPSNAKDPGSPQLTTSVHFKAQLLLF